MVLGSGLIKTDAIQIWMFGAASGGHLGDQVAGQVGGGVRGLCTVSRTLCDRPQVPDPAFTAAGSPRYNREMRSRKYHVITTLERAGNRLIRAALRAGFAPRAFALLETTGRRTGLARGIPR